MWKVRFVFAGLFCAALVAGCGGGDEPGVSAGQTPKFAPSVTQGTALPAVVAADYRNLVQQIYIAYFGRPADADGLAYFEVQFLTAHAPTTLPELIQAYNSNPTIKALVDSFSTSAESVALYPGDNAAFILAVYKNLYNRVADDGGKAYWSHLIDTGALTRSIAALSMMGGAQATDTTIINNKTKIADLFTGALDNDIKSKAYSGLDANVVVRTMLSTVTDITDPVAFGPKITATILDLANPVTIPAPVVPVVKTYTPTTTTTGQLTIFTFTGTNLVNGMAATLDGCLGITELTGGTSTVRQFSCTPLLSGPSYWVIREKVDGPVVGNFSIAVASPVASPVVSPVVSTAPKQCWVNGYYRKSGTYVRGYWRRC